MRKRASARFILIDPDERILLFRVDELAGNDPFRSPGLPARDHSFWITPGGGVEPGEMLEQAAHRELREETGLVAPDLGAPVYYCEKMLENGSGPMLSQEHFFLVRLSARAAISTVGHTELERRDIHLHRWWSLAELESTAETVYPEGFPAMVRPLLAP